MSDDLPFYKKTIKEHAFDFFILFIAITLGFFVENLREDYSEHQRAKQLSRALYNDVSNEIAQIEYKLEFYKKQEKESKELIQLLGANTQRESDSAAYYRIYRLSLEFSLVRNNSTYQMIIHSGILSFFEFSTTVRLSMYEGTIERITHLESRRSDAIENKLKPLAQTVMNQLVFENYRLKKTVTLDYVQLPRDPQFNRMLINYAYEMQNYARRLITEYSYAQGEANEILKNLTEEYGIDESNP